MSPENIQVIFKRKYKPVGNFLQIGEAYIHFWQSFPENYNAEKHKTLLFIHGLSGSMQDFLLSPLIKKLKNKYHLLLIDRPGAGYSFWINEKEYTLEDQAQYIYELLKQLKVINPIIIGHSLGGALAFTFCRIYHDHYQAKYLLLAPLLKSVPLMNFPLLILLKIQLIKLLVFRIIWLGQILFFRQLIANAFRPNKEFLQEDYILETEDKINTWYQFKAEFSTLYTVKNTLQKNEAFYKKVKNTSIKILHGINDRIVPYVSQTRLVCLENNNLQHEVINKAGHMLNFTSIDQIVKNIDELQ